MTKKSLHKWSAFGQSVRGASHLRNDLPNQDAIEFQTGTDGAPPVVLAVSDGHGSPKSFRSSVGSQLAVKVAVEVTMEFLRGMKDSPLSAVKSAAERLLTADIVKAWTQEIVEHFHRNPFSSEELDRLEQGAGAAARQAALRAGQHLIAYGATLLLAAVSDSYLFYLQLGDGDILAVSDKTHQVEQPLPQDESLIANETTSLCMDGAQKLFRFRFQFVQEVPPALILASTDGYSNSFSTPDDFHKVGTGLLDMIQTKGMDYVDHGLTAWLDDASGNGSGDDVSLGIICRKDIAGSGREENDLSPEESRALQVADHPPQSAPSPDQGDIRR
ncbi:MAG: PP2C family serine/threonine-protein phosphatase [Planctomycetota bacterium]|nr:PP2C family serine/threonine-protein phosphatase [Planctomycetota bacterium]